MRSGRSSCQAPTRRVAPPPRRADALDIYVELYTDSACLLPKQSELLLVSDQCYAGTFTEATKAYTVKTVGFGADSSFDLTQYTDDCGTAYSPTGDINDATSKIQAGVCSSWFGSAFMAKASVRLRSEVCTEDCSTLSLAIQTFYRGDGCTGLELYAYSWPVQSECLRYWNGTQQFVANAGATTITQMDYPGDDFCSGSAETYQMTADCTEDDVGDCCMSLTTDVGLDDDAPRSFSWRIQTVSMYTASLAGRRTPGRSLITAVSSLTLLLHSAALVAAD